MPAELSLHSIERNGETVKGTHTIFLKLHPAV